MTVVLTGFYDHQDNDSWKHTLPVWAVFEFDRKYPGIDWRTRNDGHISLEIFEGVPYYEMYVVRDSVNEPEFLEVYRTSL